MRPAIGVTATSLFTHPIHLGRSGTATAQPEFTGLEWYEVYSARTAEDGPDGRLVSLYRFEENWDCWEMHPAGDEVVVCLEGRMTLHQEMPDGETRTVALGVGDYAINKPGVWHTADVDGSAVAMFITVGDGTTHRPR